MHHTKNAQGLLNLAKLADWFEAGAEHWTLDMKRGCTIARDTYSDKPIPETCGTAGCIAGAAFSLAVHEMDPFDRRRLFARATPKDDTQDEFAFDDVRKVALDWLGLEDDKSWYGHPLFSSDKAPEGVTATQAAAAIRRVIAGQDPWPWTT